MSFDPQAASQAAFTQAASMSAPDSKYLNTVFSQFPNPGSLFVNPVAAPIASLNTMLTAPPAIDASAFTSALSGADSAAVSAASAAYAQQQALIAALQAKANDFQTVMGHVTTATYPASLTVPASLGGSPTALPNINQTLSCIQGEHALNQQMGTTSPTNACSPLIGSISNLGTGISSAISGLLGTHGPAIQATSTALSSGANNAITNGPGLSSAISSAKAALAAAQSQGAAAIAAAQAQLSSAQAAISSTISGITAGVSSEFTTALAACHSAIDSGMAQVNSFASSVEASVANQVHAATAVMMRNLSEQSPCMANMFQGSGIVQPALASAITSNPSASQQAANNQTPQLPAAAVTALSSVSTNNLQATVDILSAARSAVDTIKASLAPITGQYGGANDEVAQWRTANNYDAVKNAQNNSPEAMAAYQALKTQIQALDAYKDAIAFQSLYTANLLAYNRMTTINSYIINTGIWTQNTNGPWYEVSLVSIGGDTWEQYVVQQVPS